MKKNKLLRACPVCRNSLGSKLLHTQEFALLDHHLLPKKYNVVACNQCGFVFADTPAPQADYDKYYAEMSKYEMNYTDTESLLYIERAIWIGSFIPNKDDCIIDIGCGNGQLLCELQKLGLSNLTGVDPSEKCIANLKAKGISGISSSIFSISTKDKYDCAILSGVLEHICDVATLMETMKQLLKQHGLLFVCVPDASQYRNFDSIPFDYFNIEHINHFDETSLLNLGFQHGFSTTGYLKTTITLSRTAQPMIFCVFANDGNFATVWNSYSQNRIADYITHTKHHERLNLIIDRFIKTQEEVIIWGAGNFTSRLLADSGLGQCNIDFFVDKDKHKQGTNISGKPVHAPDAILRLAKTCAILVGAAVFHDEIVSEIKAMGIKNDVVVLK
jgi:SAM-dependent methyltransferase